MKHELIRTITIILVVLNSAPFLFIATCEEKDKEKVLIRSVAVCATIDIILFLILLILDY